MKTTIIETNIIGDYPFIGKSDATELIVLFIAKDCGTVIAATPDFYLGYYSTSWVESNFKKLNSVTIKFEI